MNLKLEYLLIKSSNDFCNNVDQFKNLLRSNAQVNVSDESILLSSVRFDYELTSEEINLQRNKEIVFHFAVSTEDENVEMLEKFDRLLYRINENYGSQFKINIVWNDISIYYITKLYPDLIMTENQLRKLIYRFMIKTAGSKWFANSVPKSVKEAVEKTAKKNELDEMPDVNQLDLTDFIQLGWFFFEKYTTKPLDQNAIHELKKIISEDDRKEEKITAFLETYSAKSNWERFFADKIEVEGMNEKWDKLYKYRNIVAHTKRMTGDDYNEAKKLIDELKPAFEKCLEHIDDVEMTEEQAEAIQEVANEAFFVPRMNGEDSWITKYPGVISRLIELGKADYNYGIHTDYKGWTSGLLKLSEQQRVNDSLYISPGGLLVSSDTSSRIGAFLDAGRLVIKPQESYYSKDNGLNYIQNPISTVPSNSIEDSDSTRQAAFKLSTSDIFVKKETNTLKTIEKDNLDGK